MMEFEEGNEIMFISELIDSNLKTNIFYKIIKTEKYKRKNQEIIFISILDNNKNIFRFRMSDSLQITKREKHWMESEYEILQKISMCLWRRNIGEKRLQLEIANFQNISKTSNHINFKNLVSIINSKDYDQEKAFQLIESLEYYLEYETQKIGIKIGNNLYEPEMKEERDHTDYERNVMDSFRNGEQDRFGY